MVSPGEAVVEVEGLEIGYGRRTVLEDLTFSVRRGEALTILGPSGCGKSTLLRALIGLVPRRRGRVRIVGHELGADGTPAAVRERIGVLFQAGALLGAYSAAENVALPIRELTDLPGAVVDRIVRIKLDLVRLGGAANLVPSELSGGMKKRVGLARAMALDPEVLFCDEPAAGLDPVTAREMDELLVELNVNVGITLLVVSHELPTIQDVATRCLMLDAEAKGVIATGTPAELLASGDPRVRRFFRRRLEGRGEGKER